MDTLIQKYAQEWKQIGTYQSLFSPGGINPKRNRPISPEENCRRVLDGGKPVYLPSVDDMMFFAPRIIPDNVVRAWVLEAEPILPGAKVTGGPDLFGVQWDYVPVTGGSMVKPGSPTIRDIASWEEDVVFPDLNQLDWEGSAKSNADYLSGDRLRRIFVLTGLNERLISLMDFERAMLSYVDEDQKTGVHRLFDKLCEFYDDLFARFKKHYQCDMVLFNDDWGTQRAPQFSLNVAEEMLVPYLKRIADSCHRHGMYLELHCCGKNDLLAPAIARCGVDLWMPQEINDFELLYRLIGDKVCLCIPSDSKPEMSDEACFSSALRFMDKYGKHGNVFLSTIAPPQHPRISEYLYYLSREAYIDL